MDAWNPRANAIFLTAIELSPPAARRAHVDLVCGCDADLRDQVLALLDAHEQAGGFLEAPARVPTMGGQPPPHSDGPGAVIDADTGAGGSAVGDHLAVPRTEPAIDEEPSLDFLSPTEQPESLGRLGHYEVLEVIGRGGMGVVLRALDGKLQRIVAIKVMAAPLAINATARRRFTREAQAAAAVSHEHVVTIHAVEEAGGLPYLVMQFVSGMSLQQRLDRTGPLELEEIIRIGMQTARGLAAAHAQGLVHRDVKPANILLENGVERVRLTDFGLARAVDDADLTQCGVVAGTPQYMAPEQAAGLPVDHRSDLFSLGSVLYAMCTGLAPFRASGTLATLKRVCEDTPRLVQEINPRVPDWLAAVVAKLHAKDPAARFQSAGEVAELLGGQLAQLQRPATAPVTVAGPPRRPSAAMARWRNAIAATVLVCLFAGLALTEATGMTRLRARVMRLLGAGTTLRVAGDDPGANTSLGRGGGSLVVAGTRPQEGLATARPATWSGTGSFVVLNRHGALVLRCETLVEAVRGDGNIIEIHGDGPFVSEPVRISRALVIRAAPGNRPVIQLSPGATTARRVLIETNAPLVLEGIEFRRTGGRDSGPNAPVPWASLLQAASVRMLSAANCRFLNANGSCFMVYDVPGTDSRAVRSATLRNCEFIVPPASGEAWRCESTTASQVLFDNCILSSKIHVYPRPPGATVALQIHRTTLMGAGILIEVETLPDPSERTGPFLHVDTSSSVFGDRALVITQGTDATAALRPSDAEAILPRLVRWSERQNGYSAGVGLLGWWAAGWTPLPLRRGQDLDDWHRFWNLTETGSVRGMVRFQGGDLRGRATADPAGLTPDDYRLRPDSAGYRAGPDGKDLGTEIEMVGPGKAYERWKKSPEYPRWLEETGRPK